MPLALRLSVFIVLLAILALPFRHLLLSTMSSQTFPTSPSQWRAALDALPDSPSKIPSFFFAHGSPMLAFPENATRSGAGATAMEHQGPRGPLAAFLKDFGPALLKKYKPRAIVVFSAHWETAGERLVTDYGEENPLLMDYYGFPPDLYKLKFKSTGDSALSHQIVQLYKEAGHSSRTTSKMESRGEDGRGFPGPGLDHGVFVPFRLMFGEELEGIPVVQVSIDSTLSPEANWKLGRVVSSLREDGVLVLSGGLTSHNLRNFDSFSPKTASDAHKEFHDAVLVAVSKAPLEDRKEAMFNLVRHHGFRACHPREDHFVPIYVAAGAAEEGDVRVLNGEFGIITAAFGV